MLGNRFDLDWIDDNSTGKDGEEMDLFKEALIRRHARNLMYLRAKGKKLQDIKAEGFGRCLRASRTNKGLSYEDLESLTEIPKGVLRALESGVLLSDEIKSVWIEKLADALGEDVRVFYIVLDREREDIPRDDVWKQQLSELNQKLGAIEERQRSLEMLIARIEQEVREEHSEDEEQNDHVRMLT